VQRYIPEGCHFLVSVIFGVGETAILNIRNNKEKIIMLPVQISQVLCQRENV
jgi:hypothetical protein